jgi:transcriptional regulator with XRE-family HTH domain
VSLVIQEQRTIAKQVRGKLRANHVTQRELADSVGMSEQALSNKLRGLKNFTLRDVSRIADFFDVSTDFVLGREPLGVK